MQQTSPIEHIGKELYCLHYWEILAPIIKQVFEKVGYERYSGRKVFIWLKAINFKTKNGKHLSLANIYRLLKNPFYAGTFEYPVGSGNFYTGKHQALISQQLFEQVQNQVTNEGHMKYASKEFAFTRLITCGNCGSGVTAQEKYKNLKDGTTNRYVYYGCTRAKNLTCKEGYIREEELLKQLLIIIDNIEVDQLCLRAQYDAEVKKYQNLLDSMREEKVLTPQSKEINVITYAKYILKNGSIIEKRNLLVSLRSKLVYQDKKITVNILQNEQ